MNDASLDSRKHTSGATSSGRPSLPSGCFPISAILTSAGRAASRGGSVLAGPTQLIRGADTVNTEALGTVFGRSVLGESDDTVLGCRVGAVADGGDSAMNRGHVD